jgi:hypothetical protein
MDVVISVDDEHTEQVVSVADELRAAGLEVAEVLPAIGVVTGSVEPSRLEQLETVTGVAAVEPSREVRIPPPDETLQ